MAQQPPNRPPEGWPPQQQPTQPPPGWGQPPQQGPPQWGPPGQQSQGWGPPPQRPRRRSRVFMWVILVVNILFLILMIAIFNISSSCAGKVGDELSACQAGEGIGKGILFFGLLFVWALVDVILGVIFLVTRRN